MLAEVKKRSDGAGLSLSLFLAPCTRLCLAVLLPWRVLRQAQQPDSATAVHAHGSRGPCDQTLERMDACAAAAAAAATHIPLQSASGRLQKEDVQWARL